VHTLFGQQYGQFHFSHRVIKRHLRP
jgi:hypothetical protein